MSQQLKSPSLHTYVHKLSGCLIAHAAMLLIVVAPIAHSQAACKVVYTISPQNTSQFGATLNIENTGTTSWTSWALTWTFANGQTIADSWKELYRRVAPMSQ